jgi:hypothetical protein
MIMANPVELEIVHPVVGVTVAAVAPSSIKACAAAVFMLVQTELLQLPI